MGTTKWTKKDKIACTIIFVVAMITFVVFFSTITLSYFFDEHSFSDALTAGEVSIVAYGGPNNDGKITFPTTITPNTQYAVEDYITNNNYDMMYKVKNTSTSGPVYIMVKLTSNHLSYLKPVSYTSNDGNYWVSGTDPSYMFYMKSVDAGAETDWLCKYWQIGNFTNPTPEDDGTYPSISMNITAYAVQSQGDAVIEFIESTDNTNPDTMGWKYAPQIFIDMITNS